MNEGNCSIEGCVKDAHSRTVCQYHYWRYRKDGRLDELPKFVYAPVEVHPLAGRGKLQARLSNIDIERGRADCSVHGKDIALRVRTRAGGSTYRVCRRCIRGKNNYPSRKSRTPTPAERRWHKYRLTEAEYQIMIESQGGACLICLEVCDLVVDHCHATNVVRGLLCRQCNVALGSFKDDPTALARAIRYLKKRAA